MNDQLLNLLSIYKPATQNMLKRYFDSLRGKWDEQPRIQYLLPHFICATKPFMSAMYLATWMIDYVDKTENMNAFNRGSNRKQYVLDFYGKNSQFALNLMNKLNPISRQRATGFDYNNILNIEDMSRKGIVTDVKPSASYQYAKSAGLDVNDELLNILDYEPIALCRAFKEDDLQSEKHGRLSLLRVPIKLTYKIGQRDAIIRNFDRITTAVRDQIWAEAVYMYDDQKDDQLYYINDIAVDPKLEPDVLYN